MTSFKLFQPSGGLAWFANRDLPFASVRDSPDLLGHFRGALARSAWWRPRHHDLEHAIGQAGVLVQGGMGGDFEFAGLTLCAAPPKLRLVDAELPFFYRHTALLGSVIDDLTIGSVPCCLGPASLAALICSTASIMARHMTSTNSISSTFHYGWDIILTRGVSRRGPADWWKALRIRSVQRTVAAKLSADRTATSTSSNA